MALVTTSGTKSAALVIGPIGGGADDAANIVAAAQSAVAAGIPLRTSGTFTLLSVPELPPATCSGLVWHMGGSTFNATIPLGDGVTDAALLWRASTGATLTLASNPTVGALSFTVTTKPAWLVAGALVQLGQVNCGQIFTVKSVSGSAPTVTVTVDRPVLYAFTTGAGANVTQITAAPTGITIFGEGAVWNIQASRGFELAQSQHCRIVGPLTIKAAGTGIANVGLSYDCVSYASSLEGPFEIDLGGLASGIGICLFSEQWEACCTSGPITLKGGIIGLYAYSHRTSVLDGITSTGNSQYNCLLDLAGSTPNFLPTVGGQMRNCQFLSGGQYGLVVVDGAQWTVSKCRIANNVSHGVYLDEFTGGTGGPTDCTFDGCEIDNNGSVLGGTFGVQLTKATRTTFAGGRVVNCPNEGISIGASATATRINGTTIGSCGIGVAVSATARLNGCSFTDNTVSVQTGGSVNLFADGCDVSWPTAQPSNVQGFYHQSSGTMRCTSCVVTVRAPTVILQAFICNAGTVNLQGCVVAGSGAGTNGVYINGGGAVHYDATTDLSGAATPKTGGSTTTTTAENVTNYS